MPLFGPTNVANMKARRDIKGLTKAVTYRKDKTIRENAIKAIGEIAGNDATRLIAPGLGDEEYSVRETTVETLTQIGGHDAIVLLAQSLADNDSSVRNKAVKGLDQLSWLPPGNDKASALYWKLKREYENCAACGEQAIEPLMLSIIDGERKAEAPYATLGQPALHYLIMTTNNVFDLYREIATSTTSIHYMYNSDRQKKEVIDKFSKQLRRCASTLGHFDLPDAVAYLEQLYQAVQSSIPSHPSGGALDLSEAVEVRTAIMNSLGNIAQRNNGVQATDLFIRVLENDPAAYVRAAVVDTLEKLAQQSTTLFQNKKVEAALKKALQLEEKHIQHLRSQGISSVTSAYRKIPELLEKFEHAD